MRRCLAAFRAHSRTINMQIVSPQCRCRCQCQCQYQTNKTSLQQRCRALDWPRRPHPHALLRPHLHLPPCQRHPAPLPDLESAHGVHIHIGMDTLPARGPSLCSRLHSSFPSDRQTTSATTRLHRTTGYPRRHARLPVHYYSTASGYSSADVRLIASTTGE